MKLRGRPKKYRIIQNDPKISQFSPRGRPGRPEEVELSLDQFEALKWADLGQKSQAEGAKAMSISQQTFSRILRQARKSVAEALVNGKIIRIAGGKYLVSTNLKHPPAGPTTAPKPPAKA